MLSKKPKLWVGKEAEGVFRGVHTLFVKGDVPVRNIEEFLFTTDARNPIKQVYFGAGDQSEINWNTVSAIAEKRGVLITVDTFLPHWEILTLYASIWWMVPLEKLSNPNKTLEMCYRSPTVIQRTQIKIQTERGWIVVPLSSFVYNSDDDYTSDKVVWEG